MTVRELAVQRGIEIPNCDPQAVGYNHCLNDFQPILDMEIPELEPLSEDSLFLWLAHFYFPNKIAEGKDLDTADLAYAIFQQFGQPKRKLDVEKLQNIIFTLSIKCESFKNISKAIAEAYERNQI